MKLNEYRFKLKRQLTTSSTYIITEVYPHYSSLKKKWSLESGQRFFRITIEGKLTFFGENFELIYNADLDTKFTLYIERKFKDTWQEYFRGTFSKSDCKFNLDDKSCEPNITPEDDYTQILANYENTYDLIKYPPAMQAIKLNKRPCIQVYLKGGSTISNFVGGTYWEQEVETVVADDDELKNKYLFAYITSTSEINFTGNALIGGSGAYFGSNGTFTARNGNRIVCESEDRDGWRYWTYYIYVNGVKQYASDIVTSESLTGAGTLNSFPNSSRYFIGDNINFKVIDTGVPCTMTAIKQDVYQRLLCDVQNVLGKETYPIPEDDFVGYNRNYRRAIGLADSGTIWSSTKTVTEPTQYGQNDYGEYFTSNFIPSTAGVGRPLPVCRSYWVNASIWYVYSSTYELIDTAARKDIVSKENFPLSSVIQTLLNEIAPGVKHKGTPEYSKFLYSGTDPIESAPFTLFITQKSNIIKGEYDQAAQKAEITFKSIMDMLRMCFRCYWHIDDGKFIIEHVSWYDNGGTYTSGSTKIQYDLTKMADAKNLKPYAFKQNGLEFDKSELFSRYEFNWPDTVTEAFRGTNIDVKAAYISQDEKEDITPSGFATDVDYMLLSPSEFSMDGFALLGAIKDGSDYKLPYLKLTLHSDESESNYEYNLQNGYMSWFFLVKYYMRDMPATNIKYTELKNLVVKSIKKCMEQDVRFPVIGDPGLYDLIKTNMGDGQISEMTIDLSSRVADVKLVYRPK